MTTPEPDGIRALLAEAEAAHGAYEAAELGGVYDQDWPRWYAQYALDHGIDALLSRPVDVDELAEYLTRSWQEYQQAEPKPAEPWGTYTARRIATDL